MGNTRRHRFVGKALRTTLLGIALLFFLEAVTGSLGIFTDPTSTVMASIAVRRTTPRPRTTADEASDRFPRETQAVLGTIPDALHRRNDFEPASPGVTAERAVEAGVADVPKEPNEPEVGSEWRNSLGMTFVWLPAGTFWRGSVSHESYADESPVHQVTLTRNFWIGKYEVTQAEWETVLQGNPSNHRGPNHPVTNVSWYDCQEFIARLNGREPGVTYRLPTEAEWEYACRAGTTGERYGDLDAIAWYDRNSDKRTWDVGTKLPNAWGLHDMLGNVWEWCHDWKVEYPDGPVVDPSGPPSGAYRAYRGGGWLGHSRVCRAAYRYEYDPGDRYDYLGFRLVRER